MKLAPKVIFLVRGPNGFGPSLLEALLPNPNSHLSKSETATVELSLEIYGVADQKVSVDLVHFLDPQGSPQVSILLIPNYAPPIAACAVREVLSFCTTEDIADMPVIIVPSIMKALKFNRERTNVSSSSEQEVTIYGAEIGGTTSFTQAMVTGTTAIPPSIRMDSEPLACLLPMARVLRLPTVLLIASGGQSQRSTDYELQATEKVGQFLADGVGLSFSKERIQHKQVERSRGPQEPWRALYL
ncbi:uncharacterized protein M6B38_131575 [Iris pallida]|uniref:DUF7894 domain-containing protein n=1 Tax=Iris pallida TaxID=29817 RepID=A0AAX6FRA4_IRIPA|nr:uncharacterized protein M6B38_131575 [Iris pallida]